jgi:hypothetical protein
MSTPNDPLSFEEVLTLKVAELFLARDMVSAAARTLLSGARKASKAQDMVLRADLEELLEKTKQADGIVWPKSIAARPPQDGGGK